ncbi:MAG: DUF1444 family protein [Armatimonadota bacterium]
MGIFVSLVLICIAYLLLVYVRRRYVKTMTRAEFAAEVRSFIEQRCPGVRILSDDDFVLKCEIYGAEVGTYLDSSYLQYLEHPRSLGKIIHEFVSTLTQMRLEKPIEWDEARRRIFPMLRPAERSGLSAAYEREQETKEIILYDFKEDLQILLVVEFAGSRRAITNNDLETWAISRDEAFCWAMNNLASKTGPLWESAADEARRTGLFMFATNDGYDATRIVLPDFYERASRALNCDTIAVGIPIRDLLLAVSTRQAKTTERLKKIVGQIVAKSRNPISSELFFFSQQAC